MPTLELTFASGESSLSVSRFAVHEGVSTLFSVSIWALSDDPSIDLETIVGQAASFHAVSGAAFAPLGGSRLWSGLCSYMQLVKSEPAGKSTYHLRIVPTMWLLTQRRNHRIFQHLNVPDIVDQLLADWTIVPVWKVNRADYPELEYRSQYGESDYDFLCRTLEDAGISFTFPEDPAQGSRLTLDDALQTRTPRAAPPLRFTDNPSGIPGKELATRVHLGHDVRPGAHAIRDFDLRNPSFALLGQATKAAAPEDRYEQFEYQPGAFLVASTLLPDTPAADDRGRYREDQAAGKALAQRSLEGERARKRVVTFETSTVDLWPGVVFSIEQHPHGELGQPLLVTGFFLQGSPGDTWKMSGDAVFAATPYRPPARTPKPRIHSVQSATVVGPFGQEIHTDEFGRVRVQFPWDRLGNKDDASSRWMRVSQEWAGTGFGVMTIPRIGQEVLVGFLDGDPDQPIVVGRLFNATNPVPAKLPENKTRSSVKTDTSPGSDGWNEIILEDLAGSELVYQQAQKNLRRLVKNDETITVVNDRQKDVVDRETDTTAGKRTERTGGNRLEEIAGARTTAAEKKLSTLVEGVEVDRTMAGQIAWIGLDDHLIVKGTKRERVTQDLHLEVKGSLNESFGGYSLSTWTQQEKVGKKNELETGLAVHEKAGTVLVAEGASSVTIKGPGGFITIGPGGIDIVGTLVLINVSGSPGSAPDAKPAGPEEPKEADVTPPDAPTPPRLLDPTVTIGRVMRGNPYVESGADAADGMKDSVPPTKSYEVLVTVTPQLEPGRFIELTVAEGNAANGTASVTPRQIGSTTTVTVTGGAQTTPGNAGKLELRATLDGVEKAKSAGFTVCAHPIDYIDTFVRDVDGASVGVVVQDDWHSDSGTFTDLHETEISEIVDQSNADRTIPPFAPLGRVRNSAYLPGDEKTQDTHSEPKPAAGPAGTARKRQLSIFKCHRCGVVDKTMPSSGFLLLHEVFKDGSGTWKHTFKKLGTPIRVRAWDTGAGQANVTSLEHLLP